MAQLRMLHIALVLLGLLGGANAQCTVSLPSLPLNAASYSWCAHALFGAIHARQPAVFPLHLHAASWPPWRRKMAAATAPVAVVARQPRSDPCIVCLSQYGRRHRRRHDVPADVLGGVRGHGDGSLVFGDDLDGRG